MIALKPTRYGLALLVGLAAMSGTAQAAPGLNHMQGIARKAFPAACSPVNVVTVPPVSAAHGTLQTITQSDRANCTLYLSSTFGNWSLADSCSAVVHEYGLLSGLGEISDPDSIMSPVLENDWPACLATFGNPEWLTELDYRIHVLKARCEGNPFRWCHAKRVRYESQADRQRALVRQGERLG